MSSRSSKRNSSSHSSSGDSPAHVTVTVKQEELVEEEKKNAYYRALVGSPPTPPEIPVPRRPLRQPGARFAPSPVSRKYLKVLRDFYQVPEGVKFRIPVGNESARNPPQGFFTCYEAFFTYCRMWFPIPGAIVLALHRFKLSISQLSAPALESWLGVLIASYELGIDLGPDDFEGLWGTRPTGSDGYYSMLPKKDMAVIQGTTSNPKSWQERFFFVQIDGESVEESCLHLFPRAWNFNQGNNPTAHLPGDVFVKRDLLRQRPFFWKSFTLERIRDAVRFYRSRDPVPSYDAEPVTAAPTRRRRQRSRKGKEIDDGEGSESPSPLGEKPSFTPTEKRASGFPPNNFFDGLPPEFTTDESLEDEEKQRVFAEGSQRVNEGLRVFSEALDSSFRKSRIANFKTTEAERELFRFRQEVKAQNAKQAELHAQALVRAERRGRRMVAAEVARRAESFAAEFQCFKEAQEFVGDFRECRGSVVNLHKSQNPDFSFDSEIAEMKDFMAECAHAESLVPPVEERVRRLWEPIEVSEDTVEAGADENAEGGGNAQGVNEEVDQPASSFGISASGFLNVDFLL
ncbi:hypothetical protein Bca101_066783 [Brassica carinata]